MDLDALSILESHNEKIPGKDASTDVFWRRVYENTITIIENDKRKQLNMDDYSNEQIIIVQQLRNAGFAPKQINSLNVLIHNGYKFEEILKYFNSNMAAEEIDSFAVRLVKINQQKEAF